MVASTDGFELAEKDLEIRGGGALLGARQSGLSDLRFARITHDRDLLEQARDAAQSLGTETMAPEVDALLGDAQHLGQS
jgi:ATP-dependent DNA helicase RecG